MTAANSFTGEDLANKNNPLADRSRAYNYDPIGNRKTATEAASNLTYTVNSLNQYESISGGANPETPAYGLDGNMTVAQGMIYNYNAENRLLETAPQNPQQGVPGTAYRIIVNEETQICIKCPPHPCLLPRSDGEGALRMNVSKEHWLCL